MEHETLRYLVLDYMYQVYHDSGQKLQVAKLEDIMASINTKGNIDENWLKAEIEYLVEKRCLKYVDRGYLGMPATIRITPYGIDKTGEITTSTIQKAQEEATDSKALQAVEKLQNKNHTAQSRGLAHSIQESGELASILSRVFSQTLPRRSTLSA